MKIFVKAKPAAAVDQITKTDETHYMVAVTEPPIAGRANRAIIAALAAHFGVAPAQVRIVSGHTSRQKLVEITQ